MQPRVGLLWPESVHNKLYVLQNYRISFEAYQTTEGGHVSPMSPLTNATEVTEPQGKTAFKTMNESIKIIHAINEHLTRHPRCECCQGILEMALEPNGSKIGLRHRPVERYH